jgi:hypothetical protein
MLLKMIKRKGKDFHPNTDTAIQDSDGTLSLKYGHIPTSLKITNQETHAPVALKYAISVTFSPRSTLVQDFTLCLLPAGTVLGSFLRILLRCFLAVEGF